MAGAPYLIEGVAMPNYYTAGWEVVPKEIRFFLSLSLLLDITIVCVPPHSFATD